MILRTFSKLFGLAGLRLGYASPTRSWRALLDVVQEPFNVNRPALAAGLACLRRPEIDRRAARRAVAGARELLSERLAAAGVEPVPSQANFVLALVGGDERELARALAEREGLLVRPGSGFGLARLRADHGRPAGADGARRGGDRRARRRHVPNRPRPALSRVALIAHCLLNQNAKVEGGALRPAVWEPVIELLRERGYVIRQMPCPELAFARRAALLGRARAVRHAALPPPLPPAREARRRGVEQQVGEGDERRADRDRLEPDDGRRLHAAPRRLGRRARHRRQDDSTLVRGDGIFIAELHAELRERGLPIPRSTGIRHWFPGYDAAEEHARLEALLRVSADPRSRRVALVADSLLERLLDALARARATA